jgi:formate hydrogenlyase transcriptional activator
MDLHPGPENRHAPEVELAELDSIWRALHENENKDWYQDLVEHSQDLLCIHDLEGRLLSVNPAPARMLGYSVEEILQIPMQEMVAPEFRAKFNAYLNQIASTGESRGLMAVMTRTGERRIWEYHNTLRREGVAKPIVRGMARDVTEQRRAEKLAREASEALLGKVKEGERTIRELKLFRTLVDQSSDAIEVVDPETLRFLDVNDRACSDLGYSREELLSMGVPDIDPAVTKASIGRVTGELKRSGFIVMETLHRRKDGSTFPVEISMRRVKIERDYVVTIARDLTESKHAEGRLREYERVVEGLEEMIVVVDREYRYVIANRAVLKTRDLNRDQLIGRSVFEQLRSEGATEDALALVKQKMDECFLGNVVRYGLKYKYPKAGERDLHLSYFPIEGPRGVDRIAVVLQDETEKIKLEESRKRAEDALHQNVAQLQEVTAELRVAQEKLSEEKLYLEETIGTELGFGEIIGRSSALKEVMAKVARVAPSDATVLLLGETGTGKELVARALHRMSSREGNSFIKLNCAAIPSGLLESELFGHEKGAFTGAVARKLGRLELADRGTLFLDEIGEIPLTLQPKLLRVLQDLEFERLGGTRTLKVNFRLLAATNRDLGQSVKMHEFRSDLYYRLNVFPILLPPLRERREDIRPLVEHFVHKFANRMKKSVTSIPSRTMEMLVRWEWPGNIRELENYIERSVILTSGSVLQSPLSELEPVAEQGFDMSLRVRERERILRILQECRGKLGGPDGAAARLGLKRTTLQSKLDHLGIRPGSYRA